MSRRVLNKMMEVGKNIGKISTPVSDLGKFKNEYHTLVSANKLINGQNQCRPPYQNTSTRCFGATAAVLEKPKESKTLKQIFEANRAVVWHMNMGIEEILKDYVHQEVTREFFSVQLKLFSIILMKDVVLALC